MHKVPWMCWKRMSDNWKAFFLAYAWPMPISSRILWSLSLQNHFKLNGDLFFFFFSSCQRLVKTYLFWCLFYWEMGKFWRWIKNKTWQASKSFSPRVWPSYLILAIAWREGGYGVSVGTRELCLIKTNFRLSSSLWFLTLALWVRKWVSSRGAAECTEIQMFSPAPSWTSLTSCFLVYPQQS